MSVLSIQSATNPGDLGVNLRFKEKQVIHPRARAAQDALITEIKASIPDSYKPCSNCAVEVAFTFTSNRFDIDGPIKRTLDAIQKALKAKGYIWSDARVTKMVVSKYVDDEPGIELEMW
jgi:Holliday junction resolvase RusA-like endonuclease